MAKNICSKDLVATPYIQPGASDLSASDEGL